MKRRIHSWRRRRHRPSRRIEVKPPRNQAYRCCCPTCIRLDKKERWGGAWQMSLLPLMGL